MIEESIVDNSYYKVLQTIYFEDSESKWKSITYKEDEYQKVPEKNSLNLEFALRLPYADLVEFENDEDDVVINLSPKAQLNLKLYSGLRRNANDKHGKRGI